MWIRCLLALLMAAATQADETWHASTRGFGEVKVVCRSLDPYQQAVQTSFEAEDGAHAAIIGSKRLADLLGCGDLRIETGTGLPGTVLSLDGAGRWLLGIAGATFHELWVSEPAKLAGYCTNERRAWASVPPRAYPRWLDCFDNAAPGVWVGGGGDQYVLPSDFEWLRQRRLTVCTLSPTESRLVGPGVLDTSIYDWHRTMAARYDLPYRVLFFPDSHEWLWNREPLPYVRPEPGRTVTAPWLQYARNTCATAVEPVPALDPYVGDLRRRLGEHLRDDPNWVGMHGCTEIPEAGVDLLAAVAQTPGVKELWHAYLAGDVGLDLASVGALHRGDRARYRSWDEVPVPRPGDFVGWDPATCLDLRGTWQMHEDTGRAGVDAGWFDPAKAPADWVEGDCNDPLILIYTPQRSSDPTRQPDFWMRRAFTVPAGRRADLRWLHIARDVYHGNHTPLFAVWLNGRRLATTSQERGDFDQCFDAGDALREGANELVLNTHGSPVPGYLFLGATPLRRYPQMTPPENRLWFDAVNFDAWLRVGKVESQLRASRAGDPDRPLKLMAMLNLLDLTTPLCRRYGAYQHDTGGASGYWCPMSGGRLARSHGLPFSCEQGGPPASPEALRNALTFYLMYGCDAVDMVFGVGHYRDKPAVAAWLDDHLDLLHCLGKTHLPTPRIGVLRSTRATRLGFEEPWNWDLARGALQAVGRNFAYLEVPDILDGTIDRYDVVIDDGTVLLTAAEVEGLVRYVRRGGKFVAQHHTGRHSPERADSWALARAVGLTVTPKLIASENYHRWPLGKMRCAADQDLLPSLRGQAVEGSGVAIDYLGREHTGAVGLSGRSAQVRPVATWEDGSMAVADVRCGRGRLVFLGTPFYARMRDVSGVWVNDAQRGALLDEFLTALGVPRDSWTGAGELWAEIWRSKNGVYDLYPVARMSTKAEGPLHASVKLRRGAAPSHVVELSAKGHPRQTVSWADGAFTLPPSNYGPMEARLYAAPRGDLWRAASDWFRVQAELWRALPPLPPERQPAPVAVPPDLLPLADGWRLKVAGQPERTVRLGAFDTLGLPSDTNAVFEQTVAVPAAWRGQRVDLVFDAEHWFWGILPQGRLLINDREAPLRQPLTPQALPGFAVDVTKEAAAGPLALRLQVDASAKSMLRRAGDGLSKPHGVTGLVYLQATPPPRKVEPLPASWQVTSAFNRVRPAPVGQKVKGLYLETRFTLPAAWPAPRLSLETDQALGFLMLNGAALQGPAWLQRLDISGLVRRDGENVLRWLPGARDVPRWDRPWEGVVPELRLAWR